MSSNPASTAVADDVAADANAIVTEADDTGPAQLSDSDVPTESSAGPLDVVVLDAAVQELARAAAEAEAGSAGDVGEFLLAVVEDDVAVTATFAARQPGYLGWQWSVTLALLADLDPTVSEVVLLPGEGALLAPAWVPWDERIRPGDLGVGDLLPPITDDPRLVPAYVQNDDPAVEALAREVGLGRVRVLSREGRIDFAERLHDGMFGPADEMALSAPAPCVSCAFYLPLAGSLGQLAGACGNELSPADGRVVDAGYGCGAHSETVIHMPARSAATDTVIDELSLEVHRRPISEPVDEVEPAELQTDDLTIDDLSVDEWADPEVVGAELAGDELAQAALLDADPLDADLIDPDPDPDPDPDSAADPAADPAVPEAEITDPPTSVAASDVEG